MTRRRLTLVITVAFALVLGLVVGGVRAQRRSEPSAAVPGSTSTPTAQPVAQPTGPDDGIPWVAWARTDTASATSGATQVVARIRGTDLVVAVVADQRVDLLGWYGALDHPTLVWAQTGTHQLQTLYAVPFDNDGTMTGAAAPLSVPGQPPLPAGRAFAVGGDGPALWLADTSSGATRSGALVAVSADLATVTTDVFDDTDGQAVVVTRDHVAVATKSGIELDERAAGHSRGLINVCNPPRDVVPSDDGQAIAFVCADEHVDVLRFDDGHGLVQTLPVVGGSYERLRAWWDHDGGLHVSSSTAILPDPDAGTSSVDLATDTWVPGENGVLSRVFTWGAPAVRIASAAPGSLATGDVGRVVIEGATAVDLGPTTGSVVVRQTSPTPPASTVSKHGAVGIPWTARILHPNPSDPSVEDVGVTVDGVERLVGPSVAPQGLRIIGWTGTDHRTLVVARLIEEQDDADLYRIDLDASGAQHGPAVPLTLPGAGGPHPVSGRGFLTPSGRLVVVQHSGRSSAPYDSTALRFSTDLSTAVTERIAAPTGEACTYCSLFRAATADFVVQYSWPETPGAGPILVTVSGRRGVGTVALPSGVCNDGDPRFTLSPDGSTAAVTCRDHEVDLIDLLAVARQRGGLTRLQLPTTKTGAITSWWDPSGGLHVMTATLAPGAGPSRPLRSDQMTTWDWRPARTGSPGAWSAASPPTVANRAYARDGWVARLVPHGAGEIATYDWVSDTDPTVTLETVDDPSQVLAIRT